MCLRSRCICQRTQVTRTCTHKHARAHTHKQASFENQTRGEMKDWQTCISLSVMKMSADRSEASKSCSQVKDVCLCCPLAKLIAGCVTCPTCCIVAWQLRSEKSCCSRSRKKSSTQLKLWLVHLGVANCHLEWKTTSLLIPHWGNWHHYTHTQSYA